MSLAATLHRRFAREPRTRALSAAVASLLPPGALTLDLGCGDGTLARRVMAARPDVRIVGVDTLTRGGCAVPVARYDGERLPFPAGRFDAVLLVDVVHHATHPRSLLAEAGRVARSAVVIKDHLADRVGARPLLRLMDWMGNARHGIALPYNYWTRADWRLAFADLGLKVAAWEERLGLYPRACAPLFETGLHFVALLHPAAVPAPARPAGRPPAA